MTVDLAVTGLERLTIDNVPPARVPWARTVVLAVPGTSCASVRAVLACNEDDCHSGVELWECVGCVGV